MDICRESQIVCLNYQNKSYQRKFYEIEQLREPAYHERFSEIEITKIIKEASFIHYEI